MDVRTHEGIDKRLLVPAAACLVLFVGAALVVGSVVQGVEGMRLAWVLIGLGFGLSGLLLGLGFAAHGIRTDREPSARGSLRSDFARAAGRMRASLVLIAVYIAAIVGGSMLDGRGPSWIGGVFAVVAAGAVAGMLLTTVRKERRREGFERHVLVESSSVAFFVTAIGSVIYAIFEVLAGFPRLSMWWVWTLAMSSWAIASLALRRRTLR